MSSNMSAPWLRTFGRQKTTSMHRRTLLRWLTAEPGTLAKVAHKVTAANLGWAADVCRRDRSQLRECAGATGKEQMVQVPSR